MTTTLLYHIHTLLVVGCMAALGHAAQPRIVFHEIVNPGAGKLVSSLGSYPAMSGNGNVVVYSVSRDDSQLDLYGINTDGTGQHSLGLFPHSRYRPAISYNGALAALWHDYDLYTLNTSSGAPVKVLTMTSPGAISSVAVNDDGTKVYFTVSADDVIFNTLTTLQAGVWEMNPDGSGRRLVTSLSAMRAAVPVYSPHGFERVGVYEGLSISQNNRIVFSFILNHGTFANQIMGVNADGTDLRAIGPQVYSPLAVTISRDGSRVAFDQSSPKNVNTVGWDGTGHVVQVVPGHGSYDPLRLTDNGSHFAFVDRLLRSDGGSFRSLRSGTSGSILADVLDQPYLQISADGRKICAVRNFGTTSSVMIIEMDPDQLRGAPDITNTAMTPGFVVHLSPGPPASTPTTATATAQVAYPGTPHSAFVYANLFLDGLPDPIFHPPVGTLFDDATNGDAVAGNGIFTQNQFNFGYPTTDFGPRVVRFVTENTVGGLRHATMVDHEPFFVLAAPPSGSAPVITGITPNPGTAGGIITINGSNFGITRTGNVVTLGGHSCYVLTANGTGTQLTAEVPRWFMDGSHPAIVSANGQSSSPYAFNLGSPLLNPDIDLGQTTLSFENVASGTTSDQSVQVSNTGTSDLVITAVSSNNPSFAHVLPALPLTIPSGGFAQIFIRFSPLGPIAETGTLTITSNDPDEGAVEVSLSGSTEEVPATSRCYTFNSLDSGTLHSQDNWVVTPGSPSGSVPFTVSSGVGFDGSNVIGTAGSPASNFATRVNDDNFSFGSMEGIGTLTLGFDTRYSEGGNGGVNNQSHFSLSSDTGSTSSPFFGLQGNNLTINNSAFSLPSSMNFDDWISLRLVIDLVANGGAGSGSLFYKNLTDGDTFYAAVDGLQNINLGLSPLQDPTQWTRMVVRTGFYEGNKIDNLCVETSAPTEPDLPEIVVEQPVGTVLVDGTAALAFGSATIGTPISKTVTVRNTGIASLTGLAVTSSGANASEFALGALGATTLATGESTTFTVSFTPSAAGSRSAAIHIGSNDADENPFDIALTGIGVVPAAPEIVVEQPVGTNLVDDVAVLSFGSSNVGSPAKKTLTVRNVGTANLIGLAVTRVGPNASEFVAGSPSATSLAPGESMTFTVTFTPSASGSRSASLRIASNDADENPFNIALSGKGVVPAAPEIVVEQPVGTNLFDDDAVLSFGRSNIGSPTKKTLTVRNAGTANLVGLAVTRVGANASEFVAGPLSATSLAPGERATFTVTFTPKASGSRSASLRIASNDADENPFNIALSGKGVIPPKSEITVLQGKGPRKNLQDNKSRRDFGSVTVGRSSKAKVFVIKNDGTAPLTNLNVTLVGKLALDFQIVKKPDKSIAPGMSTKFKVVYMPAKVRVSKVMLKISNNDENENPFRVALTGDGLK